MRPLRLRMKAFGPYAKTAEVDFRKLGPDGLFLIHGPTGAGKTSILDGISFALFGRASGSDRNPDGLRSDLSADDLATEAVLEFAIGGEVYRATRAPTQMLKKKRGEGLREFKADGSLEKLIQSETSSDLDDGEWRLVAAGKEKTDAAIYELLGMSEDQFRQVVVLPQGQFRKFLSAGSDEREKLLARLFRTHRFQKIENLLEEKSRLIADAIQAKKRSLESLLATLEVDGAEMLGARLDQMSKRLAELTALEPGVREACESASKRLDEARNERLIFEDLERVRARIVEIEKLRPAHDRDLQRLIEEKRARPVVELQNRFVSLEKDLDRLSADLTLAKNSELKRSKDEASAESAFGRITGLAPETDSARAERDRLKLVYASAKQLRDLRAKLSSEEADFQRRQTEAGTTDYGKVLGCYERGARLLLQLSKQIGRGEKALALRESDLKSARLRYHLSEASRLAKSLEPGKPCAVCGSSDHPAPAMHIEDGPTRETIDLLEHTLSSVKVGFTQHKLTAGKVESDWQALELALGKLKIDLPTASDPASGDGNAPAEEILGAIGRAAESLRGEVTVLRNEIEAADSERKRKQDLLIESQRSLDSLRGSVAQLESSIGPNDRDLDGLVARGQALTKKIDEFDLSLKAATERRDVAKSELAAARARVRTLQEEADRRLEEKCGAEAMRETELKKTQFPDLAACLAAALPETAVNALEKSTREFEREFALTSAKLAELSSKAKREPPTNEDLVKLELAKTQAVTEQTHLLAEKRHLENVLLSTSAMQERITKLSQEIAGLLAQHSKIGRLSEVAAGRHPNLSRVSFQRYVLAARLDEVLEQASRRLFTMSRGQFVLRRARGVDDKRRSAGLDVEVEDALSGKTRPTSTLSGGEGFLASLALAMGLSDVVQSHLGGVRLDAVFVDEGFGTLDPEALDLAMNVLSGLRSGGRLVGIISHVPELKDQIANRLVVRKTAAGSSVAWETALV